MQIADRIKSFLDDGPKTTKYLQEVIPDKNSRVLAATISNNPKIFLRLDKGVVGLRNRDEHMVSGNDINNQGLSIQKKLVNLLVCGPMKLESIYKYMPEEKEVSIRATLSMYPDFFIRIKQGLVGRARRDEYLIEKYEPEEKIKSEPIPSIIDMLVIILSKGPRTLDDICAMLPESPRRSITSKLSLSKKFSRVGSGVWGLCKY